MEWLEHPVYKGYLVSRDGIVKGKKGDILTPLADSYGYLRVAIMIGKVRKYRYIHRLVVETFIGEIETGKEVNHIDHDKTNNRLVNLELVSHSENCQKSFEFGNRVSLKGVNRVGLSIDPDVLFSDLPVRKIADIYGVSHVTILNRRKALTQ